MKNDGHVTSQKIDAPFHAIFCEYDCFLTPKLYGPQKEFKRIFVDDEDEYPTQHYDDECQWENFTYQELLQGALDSENPWYRC